MPAPGARPATIPTPPVRILVVSAHFPPNFVSGGTLVPQRTAVALQRRGHDVAVYAGCRGDLNGDDRPATRPWA